MPCRAIRETGSGLCRIEALLIFGLLLCGQAAAEEKVPKPSEATFYEHIAPILKRSCLGCHSGKKPKGKYSMETPEKMMAGAKRGRTVVAGKPGQSLLFRLVTAKEKPLMPPRKAEPLSESDILTIGAWITGGARVGKPPAPTRPYSASPQRPVYPRAPVITSLLYDENAGKLFVGGYREVLVHEVKDLLDQGGKSKEPTALAPSGSLTGEAERIRDMALAPGGGLLAVAGGSPGRFGELQLWDPGKGRLLRFRRMGGDVICSVAFSPDGSRLVVGGTDRSLHVLDSKTFEVSYSSELHSDWVLGVSYCADGSKLISCGRDRTVRISSASDGKFLKTLGTYSGAVTSLAGRPGKSEVLVAGEGMEPRIFDGESLKEVRKFEKQPGSILAAAFSADGRKLALAGKAAEIRVYQADKADRISTLESPGGWIYALAFNEAGNHLAAAGYEGVVSIWDLDSGRKVASVIPVVLEPGKK